MLVHKQPRYTHLKVFGCLAFASNPMRTTDEFQPKGVPGVILGYAQIQKGYILMNLLTKHIFVSRDVTFAEHVFPHKKHSLDQCMRPFPTALKGTRTWAEDYLQLTPTDSPSDPTPTDSTDVIFESPSDASNSAPIQDSAQDSSHTQTSQAPLRRSTRHTKTPSWLQDFISVAVSNTGTFKVVYPMTNCIIYDHLKPHYQTYIVALLAILDPVSFAQAVQESKWCSP